MITFALILVAFVLVLIASSPRPAIRWSFFAAAVLCLALGPPGLAFAQTAPAPGGTVISFGPIFALVEPYILELLGLVITAAITWAAAAFQKWTGRKIDQVHRDALQTGALNIAAAELSKLQTPANALTFDVKSKVVATGITMLEQRFPDAVKHFGLTPDRLGELIEAKIGLLAHSAPTATAVAVAPPVTAANKA